MSNSKWWEPRTTHAIQRKPWLHDDAIAKLESILRKRFTVIEQGAGGSTLWFAERVKRVVSFEHDEKWYKAVSSLAPDNVSINHKSGPPLDTDDLPLCDLLFIDGEHPYRADYVMAAEYIVKPGGWVVFDNCNRPEYADARAHLHSISNSIESIDRNQYFSKYFVTDFCRLNLTESESSW